MTKLPQKKIQLTQIIKGVYWVEIKELDLRILCSCPADIVKHLTKHNLIAEIIENKPGYETGPNAILFSDIMIQNGQFSNMAEFPVLQMLYKQGMIIPDHPNNDGSKPLLIGTKDQINAQMQYIYRGNYGLVTYEEILDVVNDKKLAHDLWRMKKQFAFGEIKHTEDLLDSIIIENNVAVVKNDLTIERLKSNVFKFTYNDESVSINLNLLPGETYPVPYPLGFHDIKREYFSIVHSGQGDGFDVNRPSMSSIITFQGKIYIIDAGPNIFYSLTTLGIGINEIEGVFQTHAHDDHFAGISTFLRSDHRIKFYATPLVRSSVFKKLAVLLNKENDDFSDFFDTIDLAPDCWNDVEGLEVKPIMSPHPVETTIFIFKTFWGGKYLSYGHFADIASLKVLSDMIVDDDNAIGISAQTYDDVKSAYLTTLDIKKIDIGGGMIHGNAEDFYYDESKRIILAHTAAPLTTLQKEIGSSAPFGIVDLMIPELTNSLHRVAYDYLKTYFSKASRPQLEKLLNNEICPYPPGSLVLKNGQQNDYIFLVLTGYIEKIDSVNTLYNMLSSGALIGEYSGLKETLSDTTYRSVSYVHCLKIPATSYREFIKTNHLFKKIEVLRANQAFLDQHFLFKDSISASVSNHISTHMKLRHYHNNEFLEKLDQQKLYILKSGSIEINSKTKTTDPKILSIGDFFYYEHLINELQTPINIQVIKHASLYEIDHIILKEIPIILWKLMEVYNKEKL